MGRVLRRKYHAQKCSLARAPEVVGERWSLLIECDVLVDAQRFDVLVEHLGITRSVLTRERHRADDEDVEITLSACSSRVASDPKTEATSIAPGAELVAGAA